MEPEEEVGTCTLCTGEFLSYSVDPDMAPLILHCGHTFCRGCLMRLPREDETVSSASPSTAAEAKNRCRVVCPMCRSFTLLSRPGDVSVLPRNFDLIRVLEELNIRRSNSGLPQTKQHERRRKETTKECEKCSLPDECQFCSNCQVHLCRKCDDQHHSLGTLRDHVRLPSTDPLEWTCKQDDEPILSSDLLHSAVHFSEAYDHAHKRAHEELEQVHTTLEQLEKAMTDEDHQMAEEEKCRVEARDAMRAGFDLLHRALNLREKELSMRIEEWTRSRLISRRERRAELDKAKLSLLAIIANLASILTDFKGPPEDLTSLQCAREAAADQTSAAASILANHRSTTKHLIRFNAAGEEQAEDVLKMCGVLEEVEVPINEETGHSCTLLNATAANDPYPALEKPSLIRTLGQEGSGDGQFRHPYGVAIDGQGNLIVTDTENYRVHVWSAGDRHVRTFGAQGSGVGQLQRPEGIAVSSSGDILVADSRNDRVQMYSADGRFMRTFGSMGSGPGQFKYPRGVAVSGRYAFVTDRVNHRVQVWSLDGRFIRAFGSRGSGPGQFRHPSGVAVDAAGNIVVADTDNDRIQVWGADGNFRYALGSTGCDPGQLLGPSGVAVDPSGDILVADMRNHRVQVWDGNGTFKRVMHFGELAVDTPAGVAANATDGTIAVVDWSQHHVALFSPGCI